MKSRLLDEAALVKDYDDMGMTLAEIAEAVGKSANWVQVRCFISELPKSIRETFLKNNYDTATVCELYHLRDNLPRAREVIEMFEKAKNAKREARRKPKK